MLIMTYQPEYSASISLVFEASSLSHFSVAVLMKASGSS